MAVEIKSQRELDDWLKNKPQEWSLVVARRSALRAALLIADPEFLNPSSVEPKLTLAVWRANSVVSATGKSPNLSTAQAYLHEAHDALYDVDPNVASALDPTVDAASAAIATATASDSVNAAVSAASAAAHVALDASVAWLQVSLDCTVLEDGNGLKSLVDWALWYETPASFKQSWARAAAWMSASKDGFAIWREWYYGRLEGMPHAFADFDDAADEKFYRWIIEQDDDWWNREPREVNAEITAFVTALRLSNRSPKTSNGTDAKKLEAQQLDLPSIMDRLTASEASTQILASEDVLELKMALKETREASSYARDELDRPSIGHNSGAFEEVGPIEEMTLPSDAVARIGEQLKGIDARLIALQKDLEKPQPDKGELAKQGKGIAERLDEIRKISPEFFKGFESQLGKGLAIGLAAGVSTGIALLFVKLPSLLHLIVSAVAG